MGTAQRHRVITIKCRRHPTRKIVDREGHCRLCQPRTLVLEAVADPVPPRCPHCEGRPPGWVRGPDYAHCLYCGADWYRPIVVRG
jgi:hypothetical protein